MKAYRNKNDDVFLFRPDQNAKRINVSAQRMCMPEFPEEYFMEALKALLILDRNWIPNVEGSSLYIRPYMFASEELLGVRPANEYKFMIFTAPVGAYYSKPVNVKIEKEYSRACEGGVGYAKAAGNYAAALYPAKIAQEQGYDQLIWTDAKEHKYIEESGTMNVMFVIDGKIITPNLDYKTTLAGITRDSFLTLARDMGVPVEVHHHEVATAGQCEIGTLFDTLVKRADQNQVMKYVIQNVGHAYGKTVTFMPKPLVGDNGSGMHVHQSLAKDGENIFAGDQYGGLSETALYYIGGIIKHARALNAFTNASTNSYKRLVPGFEAPVMLAYSARNRSASIRIPWVSSPKGRRIEVRFPDPTANSYLAFSAMLMAGLDGIQNKIHPGDAMDKDLYDLPAEEAAAIPTVCHSLDQALEALDADREFLNAGGVFTNDLIDAYIELKMEEVTRLRMTTHPVEFDMYYSL